MGHAQTHYRAASGVVGPRCRGGWPCFGCGIVIQKLEGILPILNALTARCSGARAVARVLALARSNAQR
eukprot:1113083-Lingulodinium_polyedra.AAC.1